MVFDLTFYVLYILKQRNFPTTDVGIVACSLLKWSLHVGVFSE